MKACIIDDEPAAVRSLHLLLENYCPEISVVATSTDPIEGIKFIEQDEPDVLFLDINMPDISGFQLLEQLENFEGQLIFTTAHDEYAMQAIKANAIDYLLKPIGKEDMLEAVSRLKKGRAEEGIQVKRLRELLSQIEEANEKRKRISLPTLEGLEFVDIDSIVYCASDGSYCNINVDDGSSILISRPIGYLESKLPYDVFCRIHHSYLVNINFIKKYLRGRGGSIVLKTGKILPVSTRKKSSFLDVI